MNGGLKVHALRTGSTQVHQRQVEGVGMATAAA
jgi:hypothetical protein